MDLPRLPAARERPATGAHASPYAVVRRVLNVGVALLAVPLALATGCGGKVVVDCPGGGGRGGGANAGGRGGAPGAGGGGGTGGAACTLSSAGVTVGTGGPPETRTTECFAVPAAGCPNVYNATMSIVPHLPCAVLVSVDCGPVLTGGNCCYLATEESQACDSRPGAR